MTARGTVPVPDKPSTVECPTIDLILPSRIWSDERDPTVRASLLTQQLNLIGRFGGHDVTGKEETVHEWMERLDSVAETFDLDERSHLSNLVAHLREWRTCNQSRGAPMPYSGRRWRIASSAECPVR